MKSKTNNNLLHLTPFCHLCVHFHFTKNGRFGLYLPKAYSSVQAILKLLSPFSFFFVYAWSLCILDIHDKASGTNKQKRKVGKEDINALPEKMDGIKHCEIY